MATTQHYLWASGHFLLLVSSFRYFLAVVTLKAVSSWWYKASFLGALMSYAIVCYKSLGSPQPNIAYVKRALMDENVQYFLLAIFWWTSKPITVALIPYTIFSLFHALTFVRTSLMPQFLPPGPPTAAGGPPQPHPIAKRLQVWVKANYDGAMNVVAYAEVVIFLRVILGAVTFRNSFAMPIIFAHFLRQRYYQSAFTRHAFSVVDDQINRQIASAGNPPWAVSGYSNTRMLLTRWVGGTLAPAAEAAPRR
ncbi:hypothetical protein BDN72DRAFT_830023 [Pluteus cervinus]|uniref:Uncharacterized protein n=1 Tax=Pluteus cervinus TaxID=181527 RepID=A0ACD3BG33_9AGAR|nr:hypothetical protein BDN72DRAFT_830023 [Pluteus cervinus]